MICPECQHKVTEYTEYCLECRSPLKITPQPLSLYRRRIVAPALITIVLAMITIGVSYLLYWSFWMYTTRTGLQKIDDARRKSRIPAIIPCIAFTATINLLLALLIQRTDGRGADIFGPIFIYFVFSSIVVGLAMAWWYLAYFYYNFKTAQSLRFFLESNHKHIRNQRFSTIASLIFGHMYFQSKINRWHKYIAYKKVEPLPRKANTSRPRVVRGAIAVIVLCLFTIPGLVNSDLWYAYFSSIDPNTAAYAAETGMTLKARSLLYSAHPAAADKATVDNVCEATDTSTIAYGCFYDDRQRNPHIYILAITDPNLKTVSEVTAAHEMLHHAYSLLTPTERASVDTMLQKNNDYLAAAHNIQYESLIGPYSSLSASAKLNEMHSLLAVMPSDTLTPDLETYYERYFTHARSKLIAAEIAYDTQVANMNSTLQGIENNLQSQNANIAQFEAVLGQQKSKLNSYSYYGNVGAYNALVPIYNSNIDKYKSNINMYNNTVAQYNATLVSYHNMLQGIPDNGITGQAQATKTAQL